MSSSMVSRSRAIARGLNLGRTERAFWRKNARRSSRQSSERNTTARDGCTTSPFPKWAKKRNAARSCGIHGDPRSSASSPSSGSSELDRLRRENRRGETEKDGEQGESELEKTRCARGRRVAGSADAIGTLIESGFASLKETTGEREGRCDGIGPSRRERCERGSKAQRVAEVGESAGAAHLATRRPPAGARRRSQGKLRLTGTLERRLAASGGKMRAG